MPQHTVVRKHMRNGRVVRQHARYKRGNPKRLKADVRTTQTVPLRDSATGRIFGRRVIKK
jgi:hypothetical protein